MAQKKILLLGGSAQQVIAIKTAKELGYYTVLCDYLSDNPGQYVADKYYNASTTDVEAVYQIADFNVLKINSSSKLSKLIKNNITDDLS